MKKKSELQILRELVQIQRKLISELEKRPALYLNGSPSLPSGTIMCPSVWNTRCFPGPCEYGEYQVGSLHARTCKKCGSLEHNGFTVTGHFAPGMDQSQYIDNSIPIADQISKLRKS
jgi:hypothetical protein